MTQKHGVAAVLAVLVLMLTVAAPLSSGGSDAAGGSFYQSQLDPNGNAVYEALGSLRGDYSNSATVEVALPTPVMHADAAAAEAYAVGTVMDALAARYMGDPLIVHLWDLPVSVPDVGVTTSVVTVSGDGGASGRYHTASSVTFTLTVPADMLDDPATEANELADRMEGLKAVAKGMTVSGEVPSEAKSLVGKLSGTKVVSDPEGEVGNMYDALVIRSSSSAGIAAAYTYLCTLNGIDAVTVPGTVYGSDGEGTAAYWNAVLYDGGWYAVDVCSDRSADDGEYVMAGASTSVPVGKDTEMFSAVNVADTSVVVPNSLTSPGLVRDGYEYPDDSTFFERYGAHIFMVVLVGIIVACIVYGIRSGEL
ncbi:MAG: hypothetical protein IJ026_06135 [Candidatus Methanomethylophilaceae archaeon]|nr:hypothetical protein [Candidatus Methanomethylophilaceae archaeon]